MRFNRVLLLAASVNLAVLAMLFTISCSGDKGAKGKDADFSSCAVTDGELICGGVVIGPVGGTGPDITEPGDFCFALSGTKVQCGDKILDFGVAGCNVKEYKDRTETVQVNCSGDVFGICFGVPYDFSTSFCDQGIVANLPTCGADKTVYNPNNGQACVDAKTVTQCDNEEFYWTLSSLGNKPGGIYNTCGVDTRYRECKNHANEVVGIFFIGKPSSVPDIILSDVNDDDFLYGTLKSTVEYEGTKYCAFSGTANAKIEDCEEGYVPDQGNSDPLKDPRAFTYCKLKANYAICNRAANGFVGTFDARTHVCDGRGTAAAAISSCADLNGGFAEFVPMPGKTNKSQIDRQTKGYTACGLDPDYDACLTNNNVTVGIYRKKDQICRNAGSDMANVQTCLSGMIPRADNRECLQGEAECKNRKGFWDEEKQNCYFDAQASCYEDNRAKATCQYYYVTDTDKGWSHNGETTTPSLGTGTACSNNASGTALNGTGIGVGKWTASTITGSSSVDAGVSVASEDKFFDRLANGGKGICYDNFKAWCEDGNGLWTGWTSDPNEGPAAKCKKVIDLTEKECVDNADKGYLWGSLQTANNVDENKRFCSIDANVAQQTCEREGGYLGGKGVTANLTIRKASIGQYGWDRQNDECIRLYSLSDNVKSFKSRTHCAASGYYWDEGAERCFIIQDEAQAFCPLASGVGVTPETNSNWKTNTCTVKAATSCATGDFSKCTGSSTAARNNCITGGFYWEMYEPGVSQHCVELASKCSQGGGADAASLCKASGGSSSVVGKCNTDETGLFEVVDAGHGLVLNDCVAPPLCVSFGGFLNRWNGTCTFECKVGNRATSPQSITGSMIENYTAIAGKVCYNPDGCNPESGLGCTMRECIDIDDADFVWDAKAGDAGECGKKTGAAQKCVEVINSAAAAQSGSATLICGACDASSTNIATCKADACIALATTSGAAASAWHATTSAVCVPYDRCKATTGAGALSGAFVLDADSEETRICLNGSDLTNCTTTYPKEMLVGHDSEGKCVEGKEACASEDVQSGADANKCELLGEVQCKAKSYVWDKTDSGGDRCVNDEGACDNDANFDGVNMCLALTWHSECAGTGTSIYQDAGAVTTCSADCGSDLFNLMSSATGNAVYKCLSACGSGKFISSNNKNCVDDCSAESLSLTSNGDGTDVCEP